MRPSSFFAAALVAGIVPAAVQAAPQPARLTVPQVEALVVHSDFGSRNGISTARCTGLDDGGRGDDDDARRREHARRFNRFACRLSGSYVEMRVGIRLTSPTSFAVFRLG